MRVEPEFLERKSASKALLYIREQQSLMCGNLHSHIRPNS